MLAFLARTLPALSFALAFAQGSEFTQQYLQRLGGAADALRAVVERFDAGASAADLSREAALARLAASPDSFVARQGADMRETIEAYAAVQRRYADLLRAAPFARPFVALGDPDWAIAARAAADFVPALPVGAAGLALTFAGFLFGWGLGAAGEGVVRVRRRRARRRRAALSSPPEALSPPGPEAARRAARSSGGSLFARVDHQPPML